MRWSLLGILLAMALGCASAVAADPDLGRIYVQGNQLMADGSPIYLNGANTPWHIWNEFGGTNPYGIHYDRAWWEAEFIRMKNSGINSTRIWIACDGTTQPSIDANGYVTGVSAQFWSDVDHLMGQASTHGIYVMASMMSFDFTDQYIWDFSTNAHSTIALRWRTMFSSADRVQSMIDQYLLPFVNRYADNPYLYAIDLCNEPEWIHGNDPRHGQLPWAQIQRYVAMSAAAIHQSNSKVLVTLGSASMKWNSAKYDGNFWSDQALQAQYANAQAFLDFYQYHWYAWMEPWYPLLTTASGHQITDRPLVVGELPGQASGLLPSGTTMRQAFEFYFTGGHSGHYPWSSNGVDSNGSLDGFGADALSFYQAHSTVARRPLGASQSITFPTLSDRVWSGSDLVIPLGATSFSGFPVTYSVISGPATVSGSTLTVVGIGSVVIAANQAGNGGYQPAAEVTRTLTVNGSPVGQSISFPALLDRMWQGANITISLGATASSGLPVTYSVISGPATVSGSTLIVAGLGSVVIAANQSGNVSYQPSAEVRQTQFVSGSPVGQTTTFPPFPAIPERVWQGTNYSIPLVAATSSGLPVTYSVISGPATVSGSNLTITGTGSVVIAANQPGDGAYRPAAEVRQTLTVSGPKLGRIYVQGNQLMADRSRIYLNGANTPWHIWNEFGGTNPSGIHYDRAWWEAEFIRMKNSGINSTRIWIACDGTTQPSIDANGYVTGVSAQFWSDVDHLMGQASTHGIYVMASMMSFDFTGQSTSASRWRTMFTSADRVQSMIDQYIVPFVNRYADNPALYAIDLCNEPEWIHEEARNGQLPWALIQRYVAMSAAAIHQSNSRVLVTLGSASMKWNSAKYEGNFWSDQALQAQHPNAQAFLDFYQYHWYAWMEPYYPLLTTASGHQITDRPLVIGELPALASGLLPSGTTMRQAFEFYFNGGHSGHYPWSSNGVDVNGSLAGFGADALAFKQAQPNVVRTAPSPIEFWRLSHFEITTNTGNAADAYDFDHDGLNNLLEYGLVLSPTAASCSPSVERFSYPEGDRLRLILCRDPARTDVTIEVQANNDLSGTWTTIATSAFGAPFSGVGYDSGDSATPGLKTVIIRDTGNLINEPRRFLRLRVTR